jgi:hypothetical protein
MNPLLQKTQDALLAKVDQRLVPVVNKVVNAGRKVMYSDASRGMAIQELKQATDPEGIGSAAAKMAGVLFNQSKQTIPMEVLFPATMLLMLEALQFLEDAGTVKVEPNFLAECTKATGSAFLQLMGVTPEKLQELAAQRQQPQQPAAGILAGAKGA